MSKVYLLVAGLFVMFLTQSIAFVQTNGQFLWPWFKKHPYAVSLLFGFFISVGFITAAKLLVDYHDGELWPARIYSFTVGVVSFAILAFLLRGESITLKTAICLVLATIIMCIQVFWNESPN